MFNFVKNSQKNNFIFMVAVFSILLFSALLVIAAPIFSAKADVPQPEYCHEITYENFPFGDAGYDPFGVPYSVLYSDHNLQMTVRCFELDHTSDKYFFMVGSRNGKEYLWKTAYITRLTSEYKEYIQKRSGYLGVAGGKDGSSPYGSALYDYVDARCELPGEDSPSGFTGDILTYYPDSLNWQEDCRDFQKFRWESVTLSGAINESNWIQGVGYQDLKEESLYPEWEPVFFLSYVCTWTGKWKCGCREAETCDASGKWQIQRIHPMNNSIY